MANKVNLKGLIIVFIKRFYIVILFAIVFAVAGLFWGKHVYHPSYSSESSFVVYHKDAKKRDNDIALISTYEKVLMNRIILQGVQHKMKQVKGYDGSVDSLTDAVKVSTEPGTLIIKVTGEANSPKVATKLANTTIQVFKQKANRLISIGTVHQLAKASVKHTTKSASNTKKYAFLGGLIGVVLSIIAILLLDRSKIIHR